MDVREVQDIGAAEELVREPLLGDAPGNALPLGVLGHIASGRDEPWVVAVAELGGAVEGCVIRLGDMPWSVSAVGRAGPAEVGAALGRWVAGRWSDDDRLVGPRDVADAAASAVATRVGADAELVMPLRRMVCREVIWRPDPPGGARHPSSDEIDLVLEWRSRFDAEATPDAPPVDRARFRSRLVELLARDQPPLWWWSVDGTPVCLVGIGSPAGSGERIAPVYTPPVHRGRGYAGALVAHVTEDAFARGCDWVGLFTDASNPVSNRLYAKLGYVDIGDAAEWRVSRGAAAG